MPDTVEDRLKVVERRLRELQDRFEDLVRAAAAHPATVALTERVEALENSPGAVHKDVPKPKGK